MMRIHRKNTEKGFTLTEMMVSISISVVVTYGMFSVMRAGDFQSQSAKVQMTLYDASREGLYKMAQEIRLSAPSRVTITNGGVGIQFNVPDPANPTNADFTINWNASQLIRYSLGGANGRQVLRTDPQGRVSVIANDVTALNFTGNAAQPTLVTISLSVQRTLVNGRNLPANPIQMTGQAEIRNV